MKSARNFEKLFLVYIHVPWARKVHGICGEKHSKYSGKNILKNDSETVGNITISRKFKGIVMAIDASLRGKTLLSLFFGLFDH
jgi:hypothetical protein